MPLTDEEKLELLRKASERNPVKKPLAFPIHSVVRWPLGVSSTSKSGTPLRQRGFDDSSSLPRIPCSPGVGVIQNSPGEIGQPVSLSVTSTRCLVIPRDTFLNSKNKEVHMNQSNQSTLLFQEKHQVRTVIDQQGSPWFAAKDVCLILGIQNHIQAIEALDEDEKGVCKTYSLGGSQDTNFIGESGLYNLIFRSNKPEAKRFRKLNLDDALERLEGQARRLRKARRIAFAKMMEAVRERRFPTPQLDLFEKEAK